MIFFVIKSFFKRYTKKYKSKVVADLTDQGSYSMSYNETNTLQISEIMTRNPVIVNKGSTIKEAAELMKRYNVGCVPVVNQKKVVGFFTGDDMVFKVLAKGKNPMETYVDDIMIEDLISITPQASVREAMKTLSEYDVKRLLVIDNTSNLVGFVTIKDILRIEPALMDIAVEKIRFNEEKRQNEIMKYAEGDEHLLDGL